MIRRLLLIFMTLFGPVLSNQTLECTPAIIHNTPWIVVTYTNGDCYYHHQITKENYDCLHYAQNKLKSSVFK